MCSFSLNFVSFFFFFFFRFIPCTTGAAAAAASSSFHSRKSRHHSLHLQHFGTQQQRQSPRPTILYPTVFQPLQKDVDEAIISHNLSKSFFQKV
jgi:hypothetical protein